MNDPMIHAKASAIVEAIVPAVKKVPTSTHGIHFLGDIASDTFLRQYITEALDSLGGEGNTTLKSAFSILQKHHDFIQKNGEKPSEYVEDCILRAMEEYASQFSHPSEREVLSNFAKQWNKTSLFAKITTADIDRYLAEKGGEG